jgi:RNA polymerase sigma factor (sigma-70 family)
MGKNPFMGSDTDHQMAGAAQHGGGQWSGQFQTTHWSVVLTAGAGTSPDSSAALETLCRTYWSPIYAYVRRSGIAHHAAQDLTQEFFTRLLELHVLERVCPERGRFRSFLLVSLKHFLANQRARAQAQKRGGGRQMVSLDEFLVEDYRACGPSEDLSPDRVFDRRWALAVFDRVLALLRGEYRASGREHQFECLKPFLLGGQPDRTQAELAGELNLTPGSVKQAVHRMRKRYRQLLRDEVAQTVARPEEIDAELGELIAALRS